ncbi:unnamed protein product [Soboliphyme baturini]|uniref:protein xylosyltransferase n=1 Tax=Soboliphyme baturini TaxID=241478 RepID=A0A183IU01_9BILA|nr:unnamed protein product [Soboliphyme baturini]
MSDILLIQIDKVYKRWQELKLMLNRFHIHPPFFHFSIILEYKADEEVGCYADGSKTHLLKNVVQEFNSTNGVEQCVAFCFRVGQELAGLKGGNRCFCGKRSDLHKVKAVQPRHCRFYRCPSNDTGGCGSEQHMRIFDTGYQSTLIYVPPGMKSVNNIKIAFLLQLNGRNVGQVRRMINMIYRRRHLYYVHVDVVNYMYNEMLKLEDRFKASGNFKIKRRRFHTIWGGASMLDMIMDSVEELLKMDHKWMYLINLSESDMPLLPMEELEAFLSAYNGTNFLRSHGRKGSETFIMKQGLNQLFVQCEGRMWRLGERELPHGIFVSGGSDWFGLHRNFLTFATNKSSSFVNGLRQFFRYALLPAESFFHVLVFNSQFCNTMSNINLKLTNWLRSRGCKCQYKDVVDWCGCSPNVFLVQDFWKLSPAVARQRLFFFARKFDSVIDTAIITKVEQGVLNSREYEAPKYQWINYFHHVDRKPSKLSTLVFMQQVAQNATSALLTSINDANLTCKVDKLLELNTFYLLTKLKGLLLLFSVVCNGEVADEPLTWISEAYVEPQYHSQVFPTDNLGRKLESVQVNFCSRF